VTDVTAVAAFTAAGLSLVNVGISARLARRGRLDEWRRDTELPIVAKVLTLSEECQTSWSNTALAKRLLADTPGDDVANRNAATQAWEAGCSSLERLRFEIAQLDLMAGATLRSAVKALAAPHESLARFLRPASGIGDVSELLQSDAITHLQSEVVGSARVDLRIDTHWRLFARRGLRKVLGRDSAVPP